MGGPGSLGPFDLIAKAGSGGMSTVWRGIHRERRVPVAIKVLGAHASASALRDEVRAVAGLDHPHVVMVLERGEVPAGLGEDLPEGSPYLVMEWASGGTLAQWPRPLPWPVVRDVLVPLLSALAHAHARGVIHRDIKPSNVLLCDASDARPGLKLADFGIAAHPDRDRRDELRIAGTATYMAPEQIAGDVRDEGPWTDLYALGCMVHALVSGRAPFVGRTATDVLRAHLFEPPPELTSPHPLPRGLAEWTASLLHKEPSHRPASAAEALRELSDLGARRIARTVLPQARSPSRSRRSRALEGAGLGLFGLRPVPLVDRDDERDVLWSALREVERAQLPRLVVLSGGAGTGKSRLCEWLCEEAHERAGIERLRVIDSPTGGPNEGLGAAIARHLGVDGLSQEDATARVERWLRGTGRHVDVGGLVEVASRGSAVHLHKPRERHAIALAYLEALARASPVVLWLEDAQWGADSLAFVQHLLDRDREAPLPVLVLATVRDEDLVDRSAEREILEELRARSETRELRIGPLAPRHWPALVREIAGLDGALARRVEARVAGNPQFAVQLLGDWVQRGYLEPGDEGFRLCAGTDVDLPSDVLEVWRARIERLLFDRDEDDAIALEIAAVLGPVVVSSPEWREACAWEGVSAPLGLIDALLDHRFAYAHPQGPDVAFRFAHAMLRESIEQRAREAGRYEAHHRACADVLRRRPAAPETPERLGRHLLAAGDLEAAIAPMLEGAQRRFDEGDVRIAAADLREREAVLDRIGAPETDERRTIGRLVLARIQISRGRLEEGERIVGGLEPFLRRADRPDLLGDLLTTKSRLLQREGMLTEAEAACLEALELLRSAGSTDAVASCMSWLGVVQFEAGLLDQALVTQQRALAILEAIGDRRAAQSTYEIGVIHARRQEWALAEAALTKARHAQRAAGDRDAVANTTVMLGELARRRGRFEESEARYREALELYEITGSGNDAIALLNTGLARLGRLDFEGARQVLREGARKLERRGWHAMLACALIELAVCAAALLDFDEFDRCFSAAEPLLERTRVVDPDLAWAAARATELALEAGEESRAARAHALAAEQLMSLGREDEARALVSARGRTP